MISRLKREFTLAPFSERAVPEGSLEVFAQELAIGDIPPTARGPDAAGVVRFVDASRTVAFELGTRTIRQVLPEAWRARTAQGTARGTLAHLV